MPKTEKHIVQINFDQGQVDYSVREQGQYLVVPVVMMTEGVRNGSAGPVLHLAEHYSQNPEDWNGVPVTVSHPETEDGQAVSVHNVDSTEWVVGHVQNAHIEDGKLKGEVALNTQRAVAVNPEAVNYIREGKKLEVSIGALTQDQPQIGVYDGQEYEAVTVVYHPDHLALLPGERGACSWNDGCGIRNNKEKEEDYDMSDIKTLKEQAKQGIGVINGLQDNQTGFMEISSRIQSMLDRRDSEAMIHFLKELYEDHFIYEVRNRDRGTQRFFRQNYEYDEEQDDVDFTDSRQEVRQDVSYVPVQANEISDTLEMSDNASITLRSESEDCGCGGSEMKRTKFNTNDNNDKEESIMSDKKDKGQPSGEVMEKVVGLVNNERTRFTKSDRPWLLQLNTDQLETLEPTEAPEPEVTREQAIQALAEDLADVDKLKEIVPEGVSEKIDKGLAAYTDIREKLIENIQTNTSEEEWPTDKLEGLDTDMLQRLSKSVRKTDYSGQGPVNNSSGQPSENGEMLAPAGIDIE